MSYSKKIGRYILSKGYNLSEVAEGTGLDYQSLYMGLFDENAGRELRADELIRLGAFINVDLEDPVFRDDGADA